MLTEKDLKLIKYDLSLNRILSYTPLSALRKTLALWFDVPELCPKNRTSRLDNYTSSATHKNKSDMLKRITEVDWVINMCIVYLFLS